MKRLLPLGRLAWLAAAIVAAPAAHALTLSCVPATGPVEVGVPYTTTCTAINGLVPITWSISSGALPSGLTLNISLGTVVTITGTPLTAGPYSFTVQAVGFSGSGSATQTFSGTIVPPPAFTCNTNAAPSEVGLAYTNTCTVTPGTGTAPYTWSISSGALPAGVTMTTTATTVTISGACDFPTEGNYYTLTLTDSAVPAQHADQPFSGPVQPALAFACINNGAPLEVGVPYTTTCTIDIYTGYSPYSWSISSGALPAGLTMTVPAGTPAVATISGTPTASGPAAYTLRASDSEGAIASRAFAGTIAAALAFTCNNNGGPTALGVPYSTTCTVTPGSGVAAYAWSISAGVLPTGVTMSTTATSATISGSPSAPGPANYTLQVADSLSKTATRAFSSTIAAAVGISCPPSASTLEVGVAFSAGCTTTGGTAPFTYSVVGTLPAGLAQNPANGSISGTFTAAAVGPMNFRVMVADSASITAQSSAIAGSVVAAPSMSCTNNVVTNLEVGAPYTATCSASGGTGPYTWAVSAGALPSGLTLTPATGLATISGTPTAGSVGSFSYTVRVTDSASTAQFSTATLTGNIVAAVGLSCVQSGTTEVGETGYAVACTPSGGVGPFSYSISAGSLPATLALNPTTGAVTGTLTALGAYSFTIRVTDSASPPVTANATALTGTVTAGPLVTCAPPITTLEVNAAYSMSCTVAGGTAPYSWDISAGALPGGLTLTPAGASATIAGTFTTAGAFSYTVRARDSALPSPVASTSVQGGTVAAAPVITCPPETPNEVGVAFSKTCTVSGGTAPYVWTISAGALPDGITQTAGTISGTPTVGSVGPFVYTVRVTDSASPPQFSYRAFSGTVASALSFTCTNNFTPVAVGAAYTSSCSVAGGVGPYAWSISAGTLPAGIGLGSASGTSTSIAGTPTAAGATSYTLRAVDALGVAATQAFSGTIAPALSISCPASATTLEVGVGFSAPCTTTGGTPPYRYSLVGTLPATLSQSASSGSITGSFTAPGSFSFQVRVTDSSQSTLSALASAISGTVVPGPSIGCSNSATALEVGVPYTTTCTVSNGTAGYGWSVSGSLPAGLTLTPSASPSLTATIAGAPTAAATGFAFALQVTDSATTPQSGSKVFNGSVVAAPVLTSTFATGMVGVPYSAALTASGGTPGYTFSLASGSLPAGLSIVGSNITGTPTVGGPSSFSLRVTDSVGGGTTTPVSITIIPALVVTSTSFVTGTLGLAYTAPLSATGGTPGYTFNLASGALPAGLSIVGATIQGTPGAYGTYPFTLMVTDASRATAMASVSIQIRASALSINTVGPLPSVSGGVPYNLPFAAGGGVPAYTWSVSAGGLPPGLTMSTSGVLSGSATQNGTFRFTVQVSDTSGQTATATYTITIAPASLVVITTSLLNGTVNVSYGESLAATGGVPPYSWGISSGSLPPGLTVRGDAIAGIPTEAGTFNFTVRVSDTANGSATAGLQIIVKPSPIVITTASPLPDGAVDTALSVSFAATGGVPPYSWSTVGGKLPPGTSLGANGVLSGTPTDSGTFTFSVQVSDAAKPAASAATRSFSIKIIPTPLVITTSTLPPGVASSPYAASVLASGGVKPYSWTFAGLPDRLSGDAGGSLSGTPQVDGSFTVTATVTDSQGQKASKQFKLDVSVQPVIITTASLPDGVAGTPYSAGLSALRGKPPYVWSLASGALPDGLTLSSAGVIQGTPTIKARAAFTVRVTDATDGFATRGFEIVVAPAPLLITTSALASGTVGQSYSQSLAAVGGTLPYAWSGSAPAGLTVSAAGVVSGTPTQPGSFTIPATVTDADGQSASRSFQVSFALPPTPAPAFPNLPSTLGPTAQNNITLTLASAFPVTITGTITLTFTADLGPDDPSIQFSTGGRTLPFTIAAGSTTATFSIPQVGVQSGTVAGVITLTIRMNAAGADVTPSPAPTRTIRITPTAPVLSSVTATRTTGGITIVMTGFATSRQLTQATFRFTAASGGTLQSTDFTISVNALFTAWFTNAASAQFGSQFLYTQPFTVSGDTADIAAVTVTITNGDGTSQAVTAQAR